MISPDALHESDWTGWKEDDRERDNDPRYRIASQWIHDDKAREVFDIGCGSGILAERLKSLNPDISISGCDISESAIKRRKTLFKRSYVFDIDKNALPEYDESYDVVTALDVIEHLYSPEHCLKEMVRICRKGGSIIISVPNFGYARYRWHALLGKVPPIINYLWDPRHIRVFSLNDIEIMYSRLSLKKGRFAAPGKFEFLSKIFPTFGGRTLIIGGLKEKS